jgi:hypothetical protein
LSVALGAGPASSPGDVETYEICDHDASEESREVTAPTSRREPSVLHQRADAARRAFNRADALVSVAQGYLRGDRPHRSPIDIILTIPAHDSERSLRPGMADPLEVGEMGESFVSTEAARRLSCDAGVAEVIEDEHGTPLSVGRKRRTIAGALKRALHKRDATCTYPGCTHRIFLEGHHIKHWADGVRPVWEIPHCCVACTIAMSTNTDTRSNSGPINDLASVILAVGWYPRCRRVLR